jgi:hypothetical protein
MSKLEELKAARDVACDNAYAAYTAADAAEAAEDAAWADWGAAYATAYTAVMAELDASAAARVTIAAYEAELDKTQEENSND